MSRRLRFRPLLSRLRFRLRLLPRLFLDLQAPAAPHVGRRRLHRDLEHAVVERRVDGAGVRRVHLAKSGDVTVSMGRAELPEEGVTVTVDGRQESVAQLIRTVGVEAIREHIGLFRELDFEVAACNPS